MLPTVPILLPFGRVCSGVNPSRAEVFEGDPGANFVSRALDCGDDLLNDHRGFVNP